jgi:hypothetical protein
MARHIRLWRTSTSGPSGSGWFPQFFPMWGPVQYPARTFGGLSPSLSPLILGLEAIRLQAVGQLARPAHRDHVTPVHLVDRDAQSLAGYPSLEL